MIGGQILMIQHFKRMTLMISLLGLFGCQQKPIMVPLVDGCPATLNHTVRLLNADKQINLCQQYKGKVVLIVNTASKCAFTGQYEDLEALYAKYQKQGLEVLGFPSNDFGQQEPGTENEVQSFCRLTYGVKFPMFAKIHVKKDNADPLYQTLGKLTGTYPKWNFYKYLLDRKGNIVDVSTSLTNPAKLEKIIERQLKQPS
jgi:glutathione peroxidase